MGRGRQKAKQAKIARDLKYYSPPTDLSALQRELSTSNSASHSSWEESDRYEDKWEENDDLYEDKWADEVEEWDEEGEEDSSRR